MSLTTWNILYRGSLSSCNYACDYCPFAKTVNSRAELALDASELERFEGWVRDRTDHRIGLLLTPWGEALIRRPYREVMTRLSHQPHVYRVAIQTNLSCELDWLEAVDRDTLALWTTYHPSQTTRQAFVAKCRRLDELEVRYSVGAVGLREHFGEIDALRQELADAVYLWINANKSDVDYYTPAEVGWLESIDPHFGFNRRPHESLGAPCRAGHTSFAVSGDGSARRCHFIPQPLGNIYQEDIADRLEPRPCSNAQCGCHIGYVHRPELGLYELFGDGVMERVPAYWAASARKRATSPSASSPNT